MKVFSSSQLTQKSAPRVMKALCQLYKCKKGNMTYLKKCLCKLYLALSGDLKDSKRLAKSVPKPTAHSKHEEQNHKSVLRSVPNRHLQIKKKKEIIGTKEIDNCYEYALTF